MRTMLLSTLFAVAVAPACCQAGEDLQPLRDGKSPGATTTLRKNSVTLKLPMKAEPVESKTRLVIPDVDPNGFIDFSAVRRAPAPAPVPESRRPELELSDIPGLVLPETLAESRRVPAEAAAALPQYIDVPRVELPPRLRGGAVRTREIADALAPLARLDGTAVPAAIPAAAMPETSGGSIPPAALAAMDRIGKDDVFFTRVELAPPEAAGGRAHQPPAMPPPLRIPPPQTRNPISSLRPPPAAGEDRAPPERATAPAAILELPDPPEAIVLTHGAPQPASTPKRGDEPLMRSVRERFMPHQGK